MRHREKLHSWMHAARSHLAEGDEAQQVGAQRGPVVAGEAAEVVRSGVEEEEDCKDEEDAHDLVGEDKDAAQDLAGGARLL